ncbi:MAG: 4-(cytidine 5'-diphospho)-2-C-methyl-D-erythritol kinase [Lachnospiraceae bacterium]|nr:4-(cytidine 5'-diphospho)-2-C-methyl-D-erythritol kinase [Lachnospiraceae bacterium]
MMTKEAYAKINLLLDVRGLREDGYHEVAMVMQTIGLCDTVTVTRRPDDMVAMTIAFEDNYRAPEELLKADEDNLCIRAAKLMMAEGSLGGGYDIALTKRIPVGAGLAGGSTDAAAVLRAINEMEGLTYSDEDLCRLGGTLGADIPYCILGGTKYAAGTGTTLSEAPACPKLFLVLIKPQASMPTGKIYHDFDAMTKPLHPDMEAMKRALEGGAAEEVADALGNSLEPVVAAQFPVIGELKETLKETGAYNAMMTGSGSCVYGIFGSEEKAMETEEMLRVKYPEMFVYVTKTM